jgi:hypothetical protein
VGNDDLVERAIDERGWGDGGWPLGKLEGNSSGAPP